MKKQKYVIGNWKMYKTLSEGLSFVDEMTKLLLDIDRTKVIFCPPYTALFEMKKQLNGTTCELGAQNCHWENFGAFTGEVSSPMLSELGVQYVILGHSERRHCFGEKDEWINKKIQALLDHKLVPIFCIGETLEEMESGSTKDVLEHQIESGLKDISTLGNVIVAYEPVWAIGTGLNADSIQIEKAHKFIRETIEKLYSIRESESVSILYGGSVNPQNVESLISTQGVDGFLIGGASLKTESFYHIIKTVEHYS